TAYDDLVEAPPWLWTGPLGNSVPPGPCLTPPLCLGGPPFPAEEATLYDAPIDGVFNPRLVVPWQVFDVDLPRWRIAVCATPSTRDLGPALYRGLPGAPGAVPGVLWPHTPRPVSGAADYARDLASHYWSGPVPAPIPLRAPFPCGEPIMAIQLGPSTGPFFA